MAHNIKYLRSVPLVIFFDADGTLYDSNYVHFLAYKEVIEKESDFKLDWTTFKQEIIEGSKNAPQFLKDHELNIDVNYFYKSRHYAYEQIALKKLNTGPGLNDFLQWCASLNIKCWIVSASKKRLIELSLKVLNLNFYFSSENIISFEDVDNQGKPLPYPYLLGLRRVGLTADEALAIEDSAKGIASAKTAGLSCIAIKHSHNTSNELKKADLIVSNFLEIKKFLQ